MGLFSKLPKTTPIPRRVITRSIPAPRLDYSGVQVIVPPGKCCRAAEDLAFRRFLVSEMPILPLPDCDAEYCRCSYVRFDDRRDGALRAADVELDGAPRARGLSHRAGKNPGRRADD